MYQVHAVYKVFTVEKLELNVIQKWLCFPDKDVVEKGGIVQFTCETLDECMTKLGYLIQDVKNISDITVKRI